MNRFYSLFAFIFVCLVLSCKHTIPEPDQTGNNGTGTGSGTGNTCDPAKIYFQQQVLPILVSNCTKSGCHDDVSRQDGVVLTTYTNVMNTADVEPGNPAESKLYRVLIETDARKRMPRPPAEPLTQEQKDIVYKWIQQGAQNLNCENACNTTAAATFGGTIKPILSNKCTGCHGGSAPQGGINLTTYNGVKAKVDDGRFWGAVNHLPGYSPMPKNGAKLSNCDIALIKKWTDAGAPNN